LGEFRDAIFPDSGRQLLDFSGISVWWADYMRENNISKQEPERYKKERSAFEKIILFTEPDPKKLSSLRFLNKYCWA
jgi:hypothetical protein